MNVERFRSARARRFVALALVSTVAASGPTVAATGPAAKPRPAASTREPGEESLSERRAVRGVPVDDVTTPETPELRELRRFEEQAFPRAGAPRPSAGDATLPAPALPGSWGGSGDVPPELRSPAPAAGGGATAVPDSDWLRALKLPDFPVRWDPQVLRYLDYFKNDPKGRSVMSNWLRRAGRYRELFDKVLARHGLPRDLFYLAMIESGFESAAKSRVGAGGVWQFMPGAARAYGLEVSYWVDSRRDPERAADAAARYLKDLYVRFGSWYLVFAAYNAGYGAVLRSITNYNTNDYWELVKHESGPALGVERLRPEDPRGGDRRPQPGGVRFRRGDARSAVRLRGGGGSRGDDAGDGGARGGREDRGARGAEPARCCAAGRRPIAARRGCACPRAPPRSTRRTSTRRARRTSSTPCSSVSARRWTRSRGRAASRCASCAA